ncbi:unnamed protein product [Rhodiola kirilowii]
MADKSNNEFRKIDHVYASVCFLKWLYNNQQAKEIKKLLGLPDIFDSEAS